MNPDTLRKRGVAEYKETGDGSLIDAADAWDVDIEAHGRCEGACNNLSIENGTLRQRLEAAAKVRDDFSYISGWTINTADVPTPYLLWQALRAALAAGETTAIPDCIHTWTPAYDNQQPQSLIAFTQWVCQKCGLRMEVKYGGATALAAGETCHYPDWEGGLIVGEHVRGKDGTCCVCGEEKP